MDATSRRPRPHLATFLLHQKVRRAGYPKRSSASFPDTLHFLEYLSRHLVCRQYIVAKHTRERKRMTDTMATALNTAFFGKYTERTYVYVRVGHSPGIRVLLIVRYVK